MENKNVVSIELAKKLQEAGLKLESEYSRHIFPESNGLSGIKFIDKTDKFYHRTVPVSYECVPTYNAQDLWDWLPEEIEDKENAVLNMIVLKKKSGGNIVSYGCTLSKEGPTLAESLGEMVLYLLTNGLVGNLNNSNDTKQQ